MKNKTIIMISFLTIICSNVFSESKEDNFWKWFTENSDAIFQFEKNQNYIFDQLTNQLNLIDQNLTFEFGSIKNGKREFIISAGGIKKSFPAVELLYNKRPKIDKWIITKYRPKDRGVKSFEYDGLIIDSDNIYFYITDNKTTFDVVILFNDWSNKNEYKLKNIGFLFLDKILGEYDTEMFVAGINFQKMEIGFKHKVLNKTDFEKWFDQWKKRLTTAST